MNDCKNCKYQAYDMDDFFCGPEGKLFEIRSAA
jgi:hypothetical protein